MGSGSRQPYLYSAPTPANPWDPYNLNGFNPKAISQRALQPSPPPKSRTEGPLLNFNQHPDSYLVTAYKPSENPLHPETARWVVWAKRIQLTWRFLQVVGVIGLAVCVISIRNTTDAQSWIIRIPPFVDLLTTVYGITYLFRSTKDLVPKSSASYHAFATIIDIGFIPFYVFIAMMAQYNYNESPNKSDRWTTLFSSTEATTDILQASFLVSIVNACFHGLSLIMDLYLVIMYRKIAALPPDLNPLEDKLTRRKFKHKHKNSEIIHTTFDEKRKSDMSTSTEGSNARMSRASTAAESRWSQGLSWQQSRTGENGSFNPHTPRSLAKSQQMYSHDNRQLQQSPSALDNGYSHRTSPMPSNPVSPKRHSVVSSLTSAEIAYSMDHDENANYISHDANRESKDQLHSDNWFVVNDSSATLHESPRRGHNKSQGYVPPSPSKNISPLRMNPPTPPPQPIMPRVATGPMSDISNTVANMPFQYGYDGDTDSERTKTMASAHSEISAITSSSRYSTASEFTGHTGTGSTTDINGSARNGGTWGAATAGTGTQKGKYFGDLASAMRGLRPAHQTNEHQQTYQEVVTGSPSRSKVDIISPRPKSMVGSLHYAESEAPSWASSVGSNSRYHSQRQHHHSQSQSHLSAQPRQAGLISVSGTVVRKTPSNDGRDDRHGRVVSRSGIDYDAADGDLGVMGDGRQVRGRDVSGKIAEEGRGGARGGTWGNWIRRGA